MKKIIKLIFVLCFLVVFGCGNTNKEIVITDYWTETQQLILDLTNDSGDYEDDNWTMYVQPEIEAEDVNKRDLRVSKTIEDTTDQKLSVSFSFKHISGSQRTIYTYEKIEKIDTENSIIQTLTLTAYDGGNYNYALEYSAERYVNNKVANSDIKNGRLILEGEDKATYLSVPLLKEGITSIEKTITDFENKFDINLEDYGFVNIAKACKNEGFEEQLNIADDTSENSINVYSDIDYTASGHSYFWNLNYEDGYKNVLFRKCDVDVLSYIENYNVTLEEVEPNKFYDMLMSNGDLIQRVAFYEDNILIYSSEFTYEQIDNDLINNKGMESEVILGNKEIVL